MTHQNHAVELTKGPDYLDIWVDTNNNGVRDDDDVNIFVTKSGSVYAESATFKAALDAHLRDRLKEASMALMERFPSTDPVAEEQICTLALQMIVKATNDAAQERMLPPLPSEKVAVLASMAHEVTQHAEETPITVAAETSNGAPETYAQPAPEPIFTASTPNAWQASPAPAPSYEITPDAGYTPPLAQEARDNWWAAAPAENVPAPALEQRAHTEYRADVTAQDAWHHAPAPVEEAAAEVIYHAAVEEAAPQPVYATEPPAYAAYAEEISHQEPQWQAPGEVVETVPVWTPPTQQTNSTSSSSTWELQPQEVPRYTPPSNA